MLLAKLRWRDKLNLTHNLVVFISFPVADLREVKYSDEINPHLMNFLTFCSRLFTKFSCAVQSEIEKKLVALNFTYHLVIHWKIRLFLGRYFLNLLSKKKNYLYFTHVVIVIKLNSTKVIVNSIMISSPIVPCMSSCLPIRNRWCNFNY